jgi:hypothetical protein
MHLGKNQRERLTALGCPTTAQVVGCAVTRSLAKRGLLRSDGDGFFCITPAGLRWLADELEAGRIEGALEWAKRKREENEARRSTEILTAP